MLEQARVPFGAERLQSEILVAPLKKEPVRSDALPKYGKTSASSVTNLFNRSTGYNPKGVIAGLEKRRAELVGLALAAMAKAQESREKCERTENRLEQEINQRLVAEQRLRELEEDRLRQLQAVKIEGAKTLKAVLAHGEAEARLKEAEGRIKEAENDARSLTLALVRADQKRAEAEATARAAEKKANNIEALLLGEEADTHEATKRDLVFGFLIFENRRKELWGMERALRNDEERRRQKIVDIKNFGQKQNAKLRPMSEKHPQSEGKFTKFKLPKSVGDAHTHRSTEQKASEINPKFIVCGMIITLLLFVVGWLLRVVFL